MTASRPRAGQPLIIFLLFAAALFIVGPADASRTTDARSSLASSPSLELPSLELAEPIAVSSRFGFGEDLGLLEPKNAPSGFVVFAVGTAQCELTYARNNPLKYVDPDGKLALSSVIGMFFGSNTEPAQAMASMSTAGPIVAVGAVGGVILTGAAAAPALLPVAGDLVVTTAVAHPTATAAAVGAVKIAAEGVGASPSGGAAPGQTEVVQRAMSGAELAATRATALLRGGRSGTHFVSDAVNSSAARARERLSLGQTPEFRVTLGVPAGRFSAPSRVLPANGMPGGGMERTATGDIPVRILGVTEY